MRVYGVFVMAVLGLLRCTCVRCGCIPVACTDLAFRTRLFVALCLFEAPVLSLALLLAMELCYAFYLALHGSRLPTIETRNFRAIVPPFTAYRPLVLIYLLLCYLLSYSPKISKQPTITHFNQQLVISK